MKAGDSQASLNPLVRSIFPLGVSSKGLIQSLSTQFGTGLQPNYPPNSKGEPKIAPP